MNISKLYDLIWIKADKLIRRYNPCEIQQMYGTSIVTGRGYKASVVCNNTYMVETRGSKLCCGGCKWLDKDIGCTVKSVGCKVGTCWVDTSWEHIRETDLRLANLPDEFVYPMDRLREIAKRYRIYGIRKSKEETLKNWRLHK